MDIESSQKETASRAKSMANRMHGGKGSLTRKVDKDKWDEAYDRIFGRPSASQEQDGGDR